MDLRAVLDGVFVRVEDPVVIAELGCLIGDLLGDCGHQRECVRFVK